MTALLALRNAVAAGLAANPDLIALKASVSVHGGDFKLDDLKKYAKNAPAVVVSLLHVSEDEDTRLDECTFGLACVAKAVPPLDQHAAAIDLVATVLRALRGNFWSDISLELSAPTKVTAQNLFNASLEAVGGIGMWAVGFHQLVEDLPLDAGAAPWSAFLTWDLQPTDEDRPHATDVVEIEAPP